MKKFVWTVLFLLSGALVLLFPIVRPEYFWQPFQAASFFQGSIFEFSLIYGIFVLIALVSSRYITNDHSGFYTGAIIAGFFALVSSCFWIIKISQPALASFDAGGESYSSYLISQQHLVSSNGNFGYFDFPGLSMIGSFLSLMTGLDVSTVAKIFLIFGITVLSISIYLYLAKSLKKNDRALIISILAMMGNVTLYSLGYFRPDTLGLFFFIPLFLMLSFEDNLLGSGTTQALLIVLFFGLVLASFIYTVGFFLMFASINVISRLKKSAVRVQMRVLLIMLISAAGVRFLLNFDYAFIPTGLIISRLQELFTNPLSLFSFSSVSSFQVAYTGPANPAWVTATRLIWLGFIGIGIIVGISELIWSGFKKRRLSSYEVKEISCLVGAFFLALLMLPLDNGANRTVTVFLLLTSFFGIIIFSKFAERLVPKLAALIKEPRVARLATMSLAIIIIVVLSLPSFFALNPTPNTDYVYPEESSALSFTSVHFSQETSVFTDVNTVLLFSYYIPSIFPNYINYFPDPRGEFSPISVSNYFDVIVPQFMNSYFQSSGGVFFFSPRITQNALSTWGISPTNQTWVSLKEGLMRTDLIYQNGFNLAYWSGH